MSEAQRRVIISQLRLRSFEVSDFAELNAHVTTKAGDEGHTQLLFGQSVPKWHPRIRLIGKLDMLSSLLNLAKLNTPEKGRHALNRIQEKLVYVMGEVATETEDANRFFENYHSLNDDDIDELESATQAFEESGAQFTGWVEKMEQAGAIIEVGRTAAREAESMAWELHNQGMIRNTLARWLNRLSDYLWAFART